MAEINWSALIFGTYSSEQIKWAVNDTKWQDVRISMIGEPLVVKFTKLEDWLRLNEHSLKAKMQVTNYVHALKRGGLIDG